MPSAKNSDGSTKAAGEQARGWRILKRALPFLGWFERYGLVHLRMDFVAGLTVALVLIPQSMAYAQLAGLPAYYGLYAAFLPPMVASLFGSSYQLATGPVAVVSLMTAAALEPIATAGSTSFIAYAVFLALLVGIFQFLLGVLRLGLVVNFLSHPVVNGFTNAAALIIATSQLSKLFGVYVDKADHHYETVARVVVSAVRYTHWPTLALAVLAIGTMVGLRKLNPKIPNVLVAVVVTTLISWALGFQKNETVALNAIDVEQVRSALVEFNAKMAERDSLATRKAEELVPTLIETEKSRGERSAEYKKLEHELALADLRLSSLKEDLHERREGLRQVFLEAGKGPDGSVRYYQPGTIPQGVAGDGASWRIKVGNRKVDESKLTMMGGGAVVSEIPKGLRFGLPHRDLDGNPVDFLSVLPMLLSAAVIISLLGFMEAISIAKAMAAKTGQRLDPNQELIGQGLANIVGSFAQCYPASGSFSRSAVNLQAGAPTGLSNVFSSGVVLLTLMFFTPLLYHLPQSVLASIIMMAVIGLLNVKGFMHAWKAQRHDGIISVVTFVFTLAFAPHLDKGIMVGVVLSLGLYLYRNMKPDIAMLAKHPDGSYRNASRHHLPVCKHIAVLRFNGSLFFVNVNYLEEKVLEQIATMPELRHVVIVGNGINELDASGEEMLSVLVARLRESGYEVSLTGLNDSVLDVLRRTRLYERIGEDHLFRSVGQAMETLHAATHRGTDEGACPLLHAHFEGLPVSPSLKLSVEIMKGPEPEGAESARGSTEKGDGGGKAGSQRDKEDGGHAPKAGVVVSGEGDTK